MAENTLRFVLAIDGGGTKTDAVCANAAGEVVGEGHAGPTNLTSTSVGAASFNLREALRQASSGIPDNREFTKLVIGLAGLDSQSEHDKAMAVFRPALADFQIQDIQLINDTQIALESGSDFPNAIVIISGTGSNCFGRNDQGQTVKAGGMDYLLTDQGSGYSIGRRVLREAVKSFDHRTSKTLLENLVIEHYGLHDMTDLKDAVYDPPLSKIQVADVARLCTQAADQQDEVALRIFSDAVTDLMMHITAVTSRLNFADKEFEIVTAGAVFGIPYVFDDFTQRIATEYSSARIIRPTKDPVFGALKLALA